MSGRDPIVPIAEASMACLARDFAGIEIREIVALADAGRTPMLVNPADTDAVAMRAISLVDLHEPHVGRRVVVAFERGDPTRPIVLGLVAGEAAWPGPALPSAMQVTTNEERVIVSAKSQLVLRCGKASITLTSSGKVLVEGAYILSRASGLNRLKGGAIQIN